MKTGEITKAIAQKWNNLSDQDKQPFLNQSNQDRERYEKEMKEMVKYGYFIDTNGVKSTEIAKQPRVVSPY